MESFNKEVDKLARETSTFLKDKVESGEISAVEINPIARTIGDSVYKFYNAMLQQLREGYDPEKDLEIGGAVKDLTVGIFDVLSKGGVTKVTSSIAKESGKELGIDLAKRLAGFDTPVVGEFKNPITRSIQSTTKILGDNPIGRTLGRMFGLLDILFNPNKEYEEYKAASENIFNYQQESIATIKKYFQPLTERSFDVAQKKREETIQSSDFKELLSSKLDKFVETMKKYPEIVRAINIIFREQKLPSNFFLNLIQRTREYLRSPIDVDLRSTARRGKSYVVNMTATIPERLQKAGLFEDWVKVLNALISPSVKNLPSLSQFTKIGKTLKRGPDGFQEIDEKTINLNKLFGFDTQKNFLWSSSWSVL